MTKTLQNLSSVFLSLTFLLVGHGLQQTLLPLSAQAQGWSPATIGATGSAYFFGFVLGCYFIPHLIRRVGHIRVFTFCAALAILAISAVQHWQLVPVWMVARAVTGVAFSGLYLILESWLNEQAPSESRGAVLSFYGFLCLAAMSIGQLFVMDAEIVSGVTLVVMFFGLAILPVALTTRPQPSVPSEVTLSFAEAYRASQVGPVLAGVSGFVMGLIWSNGAVYANSLITASASFSGSGSGSGEHPGANFIAATLLGGLLLQLPVGRLSDLIDRRWVMIALGLAACAGLIVFTILPISELSVCALGFLLGATAMPTYSLAIAHANDNADGKFVVISSAMLMANGIGATLAPLVYAAFNALGAHNVYFLIIGAAYLAGTLWTAYRLSVHRPKRTYHEPFQMVSRTTLAAADLDPRSDEEPTD